MVRGNITLNNLNRSLNMNYINIYKLKTILCELTFF